jgi:hypothetical protein
MRLCVADGEREQHKQLMDNLERRLHANHIVFWYATSRVASFFNVTESNSSFFF